MSNLAEQLPLELEPGIYHDIPATFYHALPYVSSTFLKTFRGCPADAILPFEQTEDMLVGQAIHTYSLEGRDAFNAEYVIMFESDLNKSTKEYKQQKAEFEAANADKVILPATYKKTPMLEVLKGVDSSLRSHPMASMILKQGFQEVTLIWDDPDTLVRCKARLDWNPGKSVLADLKKCANVAKFKNQICDLNYDVQAGHYTNGAIACGLDPDTFMFIPVEAEAPYKATCGYLNSDWLEWSKIEATRLIALVQECRNADHWPAFTIPGHITSLEQLNPHDLMEEWDMPAWRK